MSKSLYASETSDAAPSLPALPYAAMCLEMQTQRSDSGRGARKVRVFGQTRRHQPVSAVHAGEADKADKAVAHTARATQVAAGT